MTNESLSLNKPAVKVVLADRLIEVLAVKLKCRSRSESDDKRTLNVIDKQ